MNDIAKVTIRQVLETNCASNDCDKRDIANTILYDTDLFDMFCRAVQVNKSSTKINQRMLLTNK